MSMLSFKGGIKGATKSAPAVNPGEQIPGDQTLSEPNATGTGTDLVAQFDKTLAPQSCSSNEDFGGEWNREDVRLPRINLIHKTSDSELIEKFGIGGFVLNKEVKIGSGKEPVEIYVLRAVKDYVQKLPYGDPEMPAVFKSEAEVLANGGSLNYKDAKAGNFFGPRAHVQMVVKLPDNASDADEALFPYEFAGSAYAMAILTVASSAFTSVGKELATLRTNNKVMRKGLWFGKLALTSEVRKNAVNSWHIPVVKYAGENPADFAEFLHSLI